VTTFAQIALDPVVVTPGGEATTALTVRNDSDIVEAYELAVVGDAAEWSTITPTRVSLYPGTAETVTVRLTPPRSPAVRAGEIPLGVRVLPVERPDSVVVPETTVLVEPFGQLAAQLTPRRRRGWLGARYRVTVVNQGNAPADVLLSTAQAGEDLKLAIAPTELPLEPGAEDDDTRLRVRVVKRIWFGKPVTLPFTVLATPKGADAERPQEMPGELVQLPILPRWLLALLAALIALLIAWFALVGPAVRSSATQAAQTAANQVVNSRAAQAAATSSRQAAGGGGAAAGGGGGGGGGGTAGTGGQQSSATIQVQTGGGTRKVGTYTVPAGKMFQITDIVLANFQGDQGLLTISFGNRVITTIALETFRNQDYHWVTPIGVPAGGKVSADVTCSVPGTPASGQQAAGCDELLNVSGTLQNVQG
jgi:hypothetical protein